MIGARRLSGGRSKSLFALLAALAALAATCSKAPAAAALKAADQAVAPASRGTSEPRPPAGK